MKEKWKAEKIWGKIDLEEGRWSNEERERERMEEGKERGEKSKKKEVQEKKKGIWRKVQGKARNPFEKEMNIVVFVPIPDGMAVPVDASERHSNLRGFCIEI